MLKATNEHLAPILETIFNKCLELNYFPTPWKVVFVKIIPKPNKTDYTTAKSYRPISLTPNISKILEKIIRDKIYSMITLNHKQHGFVKGKSTTSALKQITNKIVEKKTKHKVALIAVDIAGAFDNAFWPSIYHSLDHLKVPAQLINIIKSYLNDRKIVFDHNGLKTQKTLSRGTPQGGVISPLLWNIILDELLQTFNIPNCELTAYADDVTAVCWDKNVSDLKSTIIHVLHFIEEWCKSRKLELSSEKTSIIYFHCKNKQSIRYNNVLIRPSDQIKILGVTFSDHRLKSKLDFRPHVKTIIGKATRLKNLLFAFAKKKIWH